MKMKRFALVSVLAISPAAFADDVKPPIVHVDASSAMVVERIDEYGDTAVVCRAPCDKPLEPNALYQLSGDGVRASNRVRFTAHPGVDEINVRVAPRSSSGFLAGMVLPGLTRLLLTDAHTPHAPSLTPT
jgi:hypothetical protein